MRLSYIALTIKIELFHWAIGKGLRTVALGRFADEPFVLNAHKSTVVIVARRAYWCRKPFWKIPFGGPRREARAMFNTLPVKSGVGALYKTCDQGSLSFFGSRQLTVTEMGGRAPKKRLFVSPFCSLPLYCTNSSHLLILELSVDLLFTATCDSNLNFFQWRVAAALHSTIRQQTLHHQQVASG